jgi:hypothetical protein
MRQKTISGAVPADTDKGGVDIRVIRDQKEVRGLLGEIAWHSLLTFAPAAGMAFVFLVFTDEGKGTVWISDRDTQDANSDEDAITVRKKMRGLWGEDRERQLWLAAKKLKGWTD